MTQHKDVLELTGLLLIALALSILFWSALPAVAIGALLVYMGNTK